MVAPITTIFLLSMSKSKSEGINPGKYELSDSTSVKAMAKIGIEPIPTTSNMEEIKQPNKIIPNLNNSFLLKSILSFL